jgi:hypothetical protein
MKAILITTMMLAAGDAEQLQITVYDRARLPQQVHATVANEVRRIFRDAGISIEWIAGDPDASEAFVMIYQPSRSGRELEDACSARRDIALVMSPAPPGLTKTVLGMAQPLARTGLNVRVFDDHVREASERERRAPAIVLAHVIAHEIGHVLLRSNVHSQRGLMSEVWTKHEYDWMEKGVLLFTADESRKMGMMLNRATCRTLELMRDGAEVGTRDRGKLAHGVRATPLSNNLHCTWPKSLLGEVPIPD